MTDTAKKITSNIASQLLGSVYPKPAARKEWDNLPTFDELPSFKGYPGCAWDVWGKDDQLGTINMLTENVVKEAAEKEIK